MQDRHIVRQAVYNVWCTPNQDNQFIMKLSRLTPYNGVINKFKLLSDTVRLPDNTGWYHLFQLGQVHPSIVNLITDSKNEWVLLSEVCNLKSVIIDVYNYFGVRLPTSSIYFMYTNSNNILIAFKDFKITGFNFNDDDVYFRTYKNTYFESTESDPILDYIKIEGGLVTSNNFILDLQTKIINLRNLNRGIVYCFVNGYKVQDINLVTSKLNDYVEYIYDSSIRTIVDFTISNLPTFESILDSKSKYILHYSGLTNVIDYNDDVDIFIESITTNKGVYVHKNHRDTLRNLTHKDFSIVSTYLNTYLSYFSTNGSINLNDLRIRLHIRKSGYSRPLIFDKSKINELYKLPSDKIISAMTGVNSNVDVWRASSLERSAYTKIMSSNFDVIDKSTSAEVYGYDSISKLVANTPTQTYNDNGVIKANVPYLLSKGCTAFEYDIDGLLLNWNVHNSGNVHICIDINTKYVEFIAGIGDDTLDETYSLTNVTLSDYVNYRFYTCGLINGVYDNNWVDVTNTDNYLIDSNKNVVWDVSNKLTLVRSDKKFYCKNFSIGFYRGVLEVPLTYLKTILGNTVDTLIEVPMGELTVFLNGKSLIENLDFYYDNGKIIIINKSYLVSTNLQDVIVRFTGFCNNQLKHDSVNNFGFVQLGRVSDNHRFDIKDSKLQRIVVDGKLRLPSQVSYYDDIGSGTVFNTDNGKPYSIKDIVVPMMDIAEKETYSFKESDNVINKQISDYMTLHINQVSPPTVNVTTTKHYLISPFLSRILDDIISSVINVVPPNNRLTNEFVTSICSTYENLLDFDPISNKNKQSKDFVIVHVHRFSNVISLDLPSYSFFSKVVEIYGNGNVETVNQISITQ